MHHEGEHYRITESIGIHSIRRPFTLSRNVEQKKFRDFDVAFLHTSSSSSIYIALLA